MKNYLKIGLLVLTVIFAASPLRSVTAADKEFSFKVTNTTKDKITKLLASPDGKSYGFFDIGSEGIAPGKTITLAWDKKTNDSDCEWFFKAQFADGEESEAQAFDFCEDDLELEF